MAEAVFDYDVVVSFAGEDRATAERFATLLKSEGIRVFYDVWEQADLWGKDLYQHLSDVYSKKARFFIPFCSVHYAAKAWTNHELRAAQARAFQQKGEYILPVRIDDTEIPGILSTTGYIHLKSKSVEEVAQLTVQKVRGTASGPTASSISALFKPSPGKPVDQSIRSSNVKLKKHFTDQDRDDFIEKAFEYIAKFFEGSLEELEAQNPGITGKFRRIDADRFSAIVYRDGKQAGACGVRRNGTGKVFSRSIAYSDNPECTNSFNESLSATDDGDQMFLKALGASFMLGGRPKDRLTMDEAAEMLWFLLVEPLQRRSPGWGFGA